MNTKIQENIMLVAHRVTTNTHYLGNGMYITSPWVMCKYKACDFVDGQISLHNKKAADSYISGLIKEVVDLGRIGGKNRVAFVFEQTNNTVKPSRIRKKYMNTISETREQVRY